MEQLMEGLGMGRLFHTPPAAVVRILARSVLMLLAYAGVFLAYYLLRGYRFAGPPFPFRLAGLLLFQIDQRDIGYFLQITIVPVLLMFLLSYLPHFRRLLQDQTAPHGTPGVLLGLAAVQIFSQAYEIYISRSTGMPYFIGTFVVFIGSLIGG
jgi:hypothetical protein